MGRARLHCWRCDVVGGCKVGPRATRAEQSDRRRRRLRRTPRNKSDGFVSPGQCQVPGPRSALRSVCARTIYAAHGRRRSVSCAAVTALTLQECSGCERSSPYHEHFNDRQRLGTGCGTQRRQRMSSVRLQSVRIRMPAANP
jgi:hypothetical protein